MGRCARLAWEHAVDERGKATVARPGVMTGHLLLGVLMEPDCAGGLILAKMRLDLAQAILATQFVLLHGRRRDGSDKGNAPSTSSGQALDPRTRATLLTHEPTVEWEGTPHTPAARSVLDFALEEANLFSPTYPIGTEHILLGLLRVPEGIGCRVLRYFGIELEAARAARDEFWEVLRLAE